MPKIVVPYEWAGLLRAAQTLRSVLDAVPPQTVRLLWKQSVHMGISLRGDMMEVSFARASVLDLDGREVALRELYRERPAVIVWLRHYG